MKRYNQGFKYFGPMEQCKDGEWVRYKDVKKLSANLESIYRAGQDMKERRHKKELHKIKSKCKWISLAALLLVYCDIVYFIFRH